MLHRRVRQLAGITLLAVLTACGTPNARLTVQPDPRPVTTTTLDRAVIGPLAAPSPLAAADAAIRHAIAGAVYGLKREGSAGAVVGPYSARYQPSPSENPDPGTSSPAPVDRPLAITSSSTVGEGVPCDGDLVPCWRVQIESRGTWNPPVTAANCGGHGCYGPYQFSGAWAGKLGLPADLSTATHDQWVNAARELWAGGDGCSNWDACGGG